MGGTMRVLVVEPRPQVRDALVQALDPVRFRVETAADAKSALTAMARSVPHAVLVGWPASFGKELVQILRGADKSGRLYVVVALDDPSPCRVCDVLAAGAHDFIRLPAIPQEIASRVDGPRRLSAWAETIARTEGFDWSAAVDVGRMRAWEEMGELVTEDLASLTGLPLRPVAGWPAAFTGALRAATITLTLVEHKVDLRVTVATDHNGATSLAHLLLGESAAGEDAMNDVLRELANTGGGAVKRGAFSEDLTWTMGIPVNEVVTRARVEGARCWSVALTSEASIVLVGELKERANQHVTATKLREGMVVVRDVRNEAGALLVPAGTCLTSTTAERVARLLDARTVIEVACAA